MTDLNKAQRDLYNAAKRYREIYEASEGSGVPVIWLLHNEEQQSVILADKFNMREMLRAVHISVPEDNHVT